MSASTSPVELNILFPEMTEVYILGDGTVIIADLPAGLLEMAQYLGTEDVEPWTLTTVVSAARERKD